ncbi:hypothetical protein LshimejAT787_0502360 [Lyophyllum shimeji]|uniref:Uncharacterized protein n=1 Tax=Lyophyllum shimeji TaxID=47721 RepID=A0A9P3PN65_LYOSH|nr:hypothetical protein LshimejAT787_0502360 [Lyophyllum shimeji]
MSGNLSSCRDLTDDAMCHWAQRGTIAGGPVAEPGLPQEPLHIDDFVDRSLGSERSESDVDSTHPSIADSVDASSPRANITLICFSKNHKFDIPMRSVTRIL